MSAIFISYRRDDAEGHAGRLFEALVDHFGKGSVFMDVVTIEPGRDFRKVIDSNVANCGAVLTIIGKDWLGAKDEQGRRRIDDPSDFVRIETISALKRDIPVIPVLVHNAVMPRADQLPPELEELAYRNGVALTHARWESDVNVLIAALERCLSDAAAKPDAPGALAAAPVPVAPQGPGPVPGPAPAPDDATKTSQGRSRLMALKAAALLFVVALLGWGATLFYQQQEDERARSEALAAKQAAAEAASAAALAARDEDTKRQAALRQREEAEQAAARDVARRDEESRKLAAARKAEADRQAADKAAQDLARRETELRVREEEIKRQADADRAAIEAAQRVEASRRKAAQQSLDADASCEKLLRAQATRYAADDVTRHFNSIHYFAYIRGSGPDANAAARTLSRLVGRELRPTGSAGENLPGCVSYRSDIFGSRAGAECIAAALGPGYSARDDGCNGSGFPYSVIPLH